MITHRPRIAAIVLGISLLARSAAGNDQSSIATIGDAQLALAVTDANGELRESLFEDVKTANPGLSALAWSATIDGKPYKADRPHRANGDGDDARDATTFDGETDAFLWKLAYTRTAPGRITKSFTITATRDLRIDELCLWQSTEASPPLIARTSLQDIGAFYRNDRHGLFVSLDFPYSRIETKGNATRLTYPPHQLLHKGERYEAHSLTLGATKLTGRIRAGFDEGETSAFDAYVQERFKPRFERPMIVSCSINNRYTQVRGDVIWATMKDHPTLRDNTDLLERELALMPRLGVEFYQVFPGVFDWGPDDPKPAEVTRLMDVARSHHVRMGDYSGTSSLFCTHYNEYRNHLDRPDWQIHDTSGKPVGIFCFGDPAFVDHYIDTVVPTAKRYAFEIHCLDFLNIQPCHATAHGHPAGRDSVYHQVRGLVRLLDAINSVSPQMMTWSNSGNWAELLPKIAWSNPNLYLTDPFIATPWQGLNMTRLLDDARREQMVNLHWQRFIPYRFLTNCQYFFSQNSIVPDIRNYEYGVLSTLAVTPNLCLGEVRPWFDRLTQADQQRVLAFYTRWTTFVRDHFDLWKTTYQVGEEPGPGAVEVYAHASGDHGYVFLVNPQYWSRTVQVPLDERLGFHATGRCEIAELYPVERLRLTAGGPFAAYGTTLSFDVPAQQVIVLEIRPAPERIASPRLYGLPGAIEATGEHYLLKTTGAQGRSQRAVVMLPPDAPALATAVVRKDVPPIARRLWSPTPLQLWSADHNTTVLDVTFRGVPAPDELRNWTVKAGALADGAKGWEKGFTDGEAVRFPLFADVQDAAWTAPMSAAHMNKLAMGPLANFCGAYVENAFSEAQETWIDLRAGATRAPTTQPWSDPSAPHIREAPKLARDPRRNWWLSTRFSLPFMYMIGAEPAFDEHTFLVLPLMRREQASKVLAWVNGHPLEVRSYAYPRNRGLGCYFADLVGSGAIGGENTLVVHLGF